VKAQIEGYYELKQEQEQEDLDVGKKQVLAGRRRTQS